MKNLTILEVLDDLNNPGGSTSFGRAFTREEALALVSVLEGKVTLFQPEPGKYLLSATVNGFIRVLLAGRGIGPAAFEDMLPRLDIQAFRRLHQSYLDGLWLEVSEKFELIQRVRSALGV